MVLNQLIIDQFVLLSKQVEAEYLNTKVENNLKDINTHFHRLKQIKRIIGILKQFTEEITDIKQLNDINGIGAGTIARVKEILEKGSLSELKNKYDEEKQQIINSIQQLQDIVGIGPAVAKKLVIDYKIRSIKDLIQAHKDGKIELNEKILVGLKYFEKLEFKIPRNETELIYKLLQETAKKIDKDLEVTICGSYRRGKITSNDIDVLLSNKNVKFEKHIKNHIEYNLPNYLELFVNALTKKKFLLDSLTGSDVETKYMGFSQLKNHPIRRIDIRIVPYVSYPTAVLYFTGPYELNTFMRKEAIKKKMILNEYGLYKLDEENNKTRIKIESEKDVFTKLGMKYLTPEQRENFNMH